MAYNYINDTLYLSDFGSNSVLGLSPISSLALSSGTSDWSYATVAGRSFTSGLPSTGEMFPDAACLTTPTGLAVWFPKRHLAVGLFIADLDNHVILYMNFRRGNNLTLVAGNETRRFGTSDGVGTSALLNMPYNLAMARFDASLVLTDAIGTTNLQTPDFASVMSVVFWTEHANDCVRQGVPTNTETSSWIGGADAASMRTMVLNVTTFAGRCGVADSQVGPASGVSMFSGLIGITVVDLFAAAAEKEGVALTMTTSVMYVGEFNNRRVSMIAPMYPASARYLTVLYAGTPVPGVTVGRIRSISDGGDGSPPSSNQHPRIFVATVEIFVATGNNYYYNVTATVRLSVMNRTWSLSSAFVAILAYTMIDYGKHVAFVDHGTAGTMVFFSGGGFGQFLQYYCCLDDSYSAWNVPAGPFQPTKSPSVSLTATVSFPVMRPTITPSLTTALSNTLTRLSTSSVSRQYHPLHYHVAVTLTRKVNVVATPSGPLRLIPVPPAGGPIDVGITNGTSSRSASNVSWANNRTNINITHGNVTTSTSADSVTFSSNTPYAVVVSSAAYAVMGGATVTGFSTARTLGIVSVGKRCYSILLGSASAASIAVKWNQTNDTAAAASVMNNQSVDFPESAWPGWRIGDDDTDDDVAYERGAAVAGAVTMVATTVLCLAALFLLLQWQPSGMFKATVRLPMAIVVSIAGLLLDGAVGGAALVGGPFLLLGLVIPLVVITLVVVAATRRLGYYETRFLTHVAPIHKIEAMRSTKGSWFGQIFIWFLGIGAWTLSPEVAHTPAMELRGIVAPAVLIGSFRGPGTPASGRHHPSSQSVLRYLSMYYLAVDTVLATVLSLLRGILVNVSCRAAVGVMVGICCVSFALHVILRPLRSVVKNALAIVLSGCNVAVSVVLFVAIWTTSISLLRVGLIAAEWTMNISLASGAIVIISKLLKMSMNRRASRLKKGMTGGGQGDHQQTATNDLCVPMVPVVNAATPVLSLSLVVPAAAVIQLSPSSAPPRRNPLHQV